MFQITSTVGIPESEVIFTASRSGGPGGQNVNKVSSRITLSFDVFGSAALSEDQKQRIAERLRTRINKKGVLQVVSQRTRSQELNRTDAVERFTDLLRHALTPQRRRVKTRVPGASKEQRLEKKKKRTGIKQARAKTGWES
jgi:ribosome-associated protein